MSDYKRRSRKTKNRARRTRKPQNHPRVAGRQSRTRRREGTKTKALVGHRAEQKFPKSRLRRTWKKDGRYQKTAANPRFKK